MEMFLEFNGWEMFTLKDKNGTITFFRHDPNHFIFFSKRFKMLLLDGNTFYICDFPDILTY